jgi:hypothetical protein
MLLIREATGGPDWQHIERGACAGGLHEDTNYLFGLPAARGQRIFVDDEELLRTARDQFPWRPALYAGRVAVEVVEASGEVQQCWLDVSPRPEKSGQAHFAEMIEWIRAFDPSLLAGDSSATLDFGRKHEEDVSRLLAEDIALMRLRRYGPKFLKAVEAISRTPHRSISAESAVLPLSRVTRLHPLAMRDRRLAQFALKGPDAGVDLQSVQLRSLTSIITFDSPPNRAIFALLKRVCSRIRYLQEAMRSRALRTDSDEQKARAERRLEILDGLHARAVRLIRCPVFKEVTKTEVTAASLTQIAAQPIYSKAHRSGVMALMRGISGDNVSDPLHILPSWGIYELWCFLAVVDCLAKQQDAAPVLTSGITASAKLAYAIDMKDGRRLEILFQARFAARDRAPAERLARSISREREPDIVLVEHGPRRRAMVLDAKWRAGRSNVLDAMASAHIYHDALRLGEDERLSPCLLLLPSGSGVDGLESRTFMQHHQVGAVGHFCIDGPGIVSLSDILRGWLEGTL